MSNAETTRRLNISIATRWGMFTAAGNRRLTALATRCLADVEKTDFSKPAVRKALVKFLAAYERAGNTKSFGEASDTAVRECVGSFHDRIWNNCFTFGAYEAWEENRDAAYRRNAKALAKRRAA